MHPGVTKHCLVAIGVTSWTSIFVKLLWHCWCNALSLQWTLDLETYHKSWFLRQLLSMPPSTYPWSQALAGKRAVLREDAGSKRLDGVCFVTRKPMSFMRGVMMNQAFLLIEWSVWLVSWPLVRDSTSLEFSRVRSEIVLRALTAICPWDICIKAFYWTRMWSLSDINFGR
jgi:hypothetical protein